MHIYDRTTFLFIFNIRISRGRAIARNGCDWLTLSLFSYVGFFIPAFFTYGTRALLFFCSVIIYWLPVMQSILVESVDIYWQSVHIYWFGFREHVMWSQVKLYLPNRSTLVHLFISLDIPHIKYKSYNVLTKGFAPSSGMQGFCDRIDWNMSSHLYVSLSLDSGCFEMVSCPFGIYS